MQVIARYRNGNITTTLYDDGTKLRYCPDDIPRTEFAENIDIKITDACDGGCPFCHEASTKDGAHGAIMSLPFLDTLHAGQELAIGGGNVLLHPQLDDFLLLLKEKKVISNITVMCRHFVESVDRIYKLFLNKMIYGIGVSVPADLNREYIKKLTEALDKYPDMKKNIVIHVIAGVISNTTLNRLANKGYKLLILGYKDLRKGIEYKENHDISKKTEMIKTYVKHILTEKTGEFEVVSFDNLALSQLDIKSIVPKEDWMAYYMGADATSTFYIDVPNFKFAASSTAPLDKRYNIMDNLDHMFNYIRKD